ncbi:MAG TPA: hypothetical protein VFV94_01360, partial [Polyangiaceae bacterium]|nr:hypothetical protein [Polyangiaceae bacterium]
MMNALRLAFPRRTALEPLATLLALGALLTACTSKEDDSPQHGASAGQSGTGTSLGGTSSGQGGTAGAGATGGASASGGTSGGTGGSPPSGGSAGRMASGGSSGTLGGSAGNSGSAGMGGGSGSGSGNGAGGSAGVAGSAAGSGGSAGEVTTPGVHFVGRVDAADPANARFAWSGTGVVARFNGTEVSATLGGSQQFTVVVDGMVQPKLTAKTGKNTLATGLAAGEHTVELYRRTEASLGVATFMGFDFGGGTLLAPPVPTRRL